MEVSWWDLKFGNWYLVLVTWNLEFGIWNLILAFIPHKSHLKFSGNPVDARQNPCRKYQ
jgi:hypothetical protein